MFAIEYLKTIISGLKAYFSWGNLKDKPDFANVAYSGSYNDLSNKPSYANVAITGDYNDLTNKPDSNTIVPCESMIVKIGTTTRAKMQASVASAKTNGSDMRIIYRNSSGTNIHTFYCTYDSIKAITDTDTYWQIDHPISITRGTYIDNTPILRVMFMFDDNGIVSDESFVRYMYEMYLATDSSGTKVFKITVDSSGQLTTTEA